ncbi:efflux RND transporter permease subunit [Gracilibacillus alcaliphilus]|uniref:efflux RND transporter permease subunit n=1 Tax=Gracilibacillus alcaliphilus TaxID=1401441 RepID=UPI00195C40C4|nr:MMPL family transporter [Gracilibacillus alcaliphilus]
MINFPSIITKYKKTIVVSFFLVALISCITQFAVTVNYNMADYLPAEAPSSIAMDVMEDEFQTGIENARVLIHDVSVQEALLYKEKLAALDGVSDVMWLDDAVDLKIPLELIDDDTVENYYKDNQALISLHIREGEEVRITEEIYQLIGEDNALAGEAVNTAYSQEMAGTESAYAALLLVPIIIIILVLSTNSWIEPVFFLTAIGVSVLINLGTNIFLGEVSFVTQSVAPILQLAVSLDYAIFLLHSFSDFRKQGQTPEAAMKSAIKQSFPAIGASASTTFFGFIALSFMEFEIGADLGINLVKGIVLSFLSVMIFLPALTLTFYKWMEKTEHKQIIPQLMGIGRHVLKFRIPVILLVFLLVVPAFLAQANTNFIYGMGDQPEETRIGRDAALVEEEFGKSTPIIALVPKEDLAKETEFVQNVKQLNHVTSVLAYTEAVSPVIPPEYLDESVTENFYSDNYARIIVHTDTEEEGETAFSLVDEVTAMVTNYYDDDAYLLGGSVTLHDMKSTVERDNTLVTTLTVLTIGLVLMFVFRSLSFPVVLLLTIQSSVWINLAIPYFSGDSLVFVGYLIISTVQLAATVDYAILLSEAYKEHRKEMPALQAVKRTLDEKFFSILISASILSSVGFILWITSTNPIVSSIGLLLGRGALLAFILVLFLLPAILVLFDKLIEKTSWKANFYREKG